MLRFCFLFFFCITTIKNADISQAKDLAPNPYEIEKLKGNSIPTFQIETFNKGFINSSNFSGKRVLVTFWASWSPVSAEDLMRIYENIKNKDIILLAICIDKEKEKANFLIKDLTQQNVIFAYDKGGRVSKDLFKVFMIPTTIYVNDKGIIETIYLGLQDWNYKIKRIT
ncbi:MAG TPA: TlpA family protein disulfide reductase [Nitrospirae bacterium]|nr:TlpA family protein disulfide reductase [Nitrospirota bacterium]